MKIATLYSSRQYKPFTGQQEISLDDGTVLYIRSTVSENKDVDPLEDALTHAKPTEGETVLNTIPLE